MNITTISERLGKGIARPHKVCIRKWLFLPILSLSYKDNDAVPFILYKKQDELCIITGESKETHSLLIERMMYVSLGDEVVLLEGCLWKERKAITFKISSVMVDVVCVLQQMLKDYEEIDISHFTVYSEANGHVFSTLINNVYAEESVCNIEKAIKIALNNEASRESAEGMVYSIKGNAPMTNSLCHKFLPGFTRWFYDGQSYNSNMIIKAIKDTPYEYDGNFNGLTYLEFTDGIKDKIKRLKNTLHKQIKLKGACKYDIIPIPDYETCQQYKGEANWCILDCESDYQYYTDDGQMFYFCKIKQLEFLNEIKEYARIHNSFSLSMIAVQVDRFGFIESVTDLLNNLLIIDEKELSQLVGVNFFDVFKPKAST